MTAPSRSSSSRGGGSGSHTASSRSLQLLVQVLASAAVCAIGFADMYSYSMTDSFLGQVLAHKGASSSVVMLSLVSKQLQRHQCRCCRHMRNVHSSTLEQLCLPAQAVHVPVGAKNLLTGVCHGSVAQSSNVCFCSLGCPPYSQATVAVAA
jgi:hypothetical protein